MSATEAIVTPDPQAAVITYLNAELAEPVYSRVPQTRPAKFVKAMSTGGGNRTDMVLDRVTFVLESWASTEADAAELAWRADGYILAAGRRSDAFHHVTRFSAPGNLPDPESEQFRFTATYQAIIRAVAL